MSPIQNVALVHGGFVDGSGWKGVYELLRQEGYDVSVVQNPTMSLEDDVAVTNRVLNGQDGPTVLVGHSYGGAVISQAGTHENVVALVYIAAFVPDSGESVNTLLADPRLGDPVPPILSPQDAFRVLVRDKFPEAFARDLPRNEAEFLADSQVFWGLDALEGVVTDPAWRAKPSWYLVATDDHVIAPRLQRMMSEKAGSTVVEVSGSHAIYISQPAAVASLIMQASNA